MYKTKKVAINAKRFNDILLGMPLVAEIRGRRFPGGNNIIYKNNR